MTPATVLCAFDASFGAGLLEALTQVAVEDTGCLLVAYDTAYPEPLHSARPIPDAFGIALVLTPQRSAQSLARIQRQPDAMPRRTALADAELEALRSAIPAARGLPLLQRVARGEAGGWSSTICAPLRLAVATSEPCR